MHVQVTNTRRGPQPPPSEPSITSPPERHKELAARQTATGSSGATEICGYMHFGEDWEAWSCVSATTCKTINDHYFGCFPNVYTTCYPSTACADALTLGSRDMCCNDETFMECVTGYKTAGDSELTGFRCAVSTVQGDLSVYGDTTVPGTTTSASITDPVINGTNPPDPIPPPNPGPGTPVGAIVGGVIGGVALIALVAFGILFMRSKKKKKTTSPPPPPQQPPMHYLPPSYQSEIAVSPPPPPPPESPYQYQQSPIPGQYAQKYEIPRSPVALEMPTEAARDSRGPVELL